MWTLALALAACTLPHPLVTPATLPPPTAPGDWDAPGPIEAEVHVSARMAVPRSGLLDLTDPAAARLADEPVQVVLPVVVLHHPTAGTLVIDTGIDAELAAGRDGAVRAPLRSLISDFQPVKGLGAILDGRAPDRVLMTHLHSDHVLGLPDVPDAVPVVFGPGELDGRSVMNAVTGRTIGAALGQHAMQELPSASAVPVDLAGTSVEAWDLLGDGSLWALHLPGHTPGSLAFVARTVDGPLLVTGDASHTRWGWDHDVPPGTYSEDPEQCARAFAVLRAFAAQHPAMRVQVGHEE